MRGVLNNPYTPVVALTVFVFALPLLPSPFLLRIATLVYIYGLAVVGLSFLMGYAGQISLGHAAFFVLGAYSVAIGPAHLSISPLISLFAGVVLTGVLAYACGRPILRFKGYHLAMATLALGAIVHIVLKNTNNWTGGPVGMTVAPLMIGDWSISGVVEWYWISGITMVVAVLCIANLLQSGTGRALRAIHDGEIPAGVLGIDVGRYKVIAFVISAVYAALAGGYFALFNGYIAPNAGGVMQSVEFVAMAVLGGLGSLVGAILGTAVLVALPQALTVLNEFEDVFLGFILMVLMIFLRSGIIPTLHSWLSRKLA